ncbi:MAG: DNA replication/repair protein RecF [Eubacteriales bacterium]|nr:DNA replication/repair protein RecF [Eubacteriales bacterium]
MFIEKLELKNFRNYEELVLSLDEEINIFFGNNGQGKTNLLEAIYLMSSARSPLTAKDRELIRQGENFYEVSLEFRPKQSDVNYRESLKISYRDSNKSGDRSGRERKIFHDGLELDRLNQLYGLFNAVIFAPEDLLMIKEGPALRRRFLDLLICQMNRPYFILLQKFQRIITQRNNLLKRMRDEEKKGRSKDETFLLRAELKIWNQHFAKVSSEIINERRATICELNQLAKNFHSIMSDDSEVLELKYKTVSRILEDDDLTQIEAKILERLEHEERDDVLRGNTSSGPQRDDIDIFLNQQPIKIYGSQGQQRSAVLSMKIAELRLIEARRREKPVLILDDVMSELDQKRRQALLSAVKDMQVFISCTDPIQVNQDFSELIKLERAAFFEVKSAKVERCTEEYLKELFNKNT